MPSKQTLPSEMKAVLVSKFGHPDNVMKVGTAKTPTSSSSTSKKDDAIIIKVLAASLTPGDYRALLGDKTIVCNPKVWPYIPGGDVCGTVVQIPNGCKEFKIGDKVVGTWEMWGIGGMAEYHVVNPKKLVKLPSNLSPEEGAALANSASHALKMVEKAKIKKGDRVLVLGGSGGIGVTLIQMLRKKGVSYIGSTSTDSVLMKELGVDKNINYQKEHFSEVKEWQQQKFDCIIDVAVGLQAWKSCQPVLKTARQGGRYVTAVFDQHYIDGTSFHKAIGLLFPPFMREMKNPFRRTTPYYRMYLDEPTRESMEMVLNMASKGEFKTILDKSSPHAFTTQAVQDAWNLHIARKGHGKIVIRIAEDDGEIET